MNSIEIKITINNQEPIVKFELFREPLTKEEINIALDHDITINEMVTSIIQNLLESVSDDDEFELTLYHPKINE